MAVNKILRKDNKICTCNNAEERRGVMYATYSSICVSGEQEINDAHITKC